MTNATSAPELRDFIDWYVSSELGEKTMSEAMRVVSCEASNAWQGEGWYAIGFDSEPETYEPSFYGTQNDLAIDAYAAACITNAPGEVWIDFQGTTPDFS